MPDSSGRPDLRLIAQELADRPRLIVGSVTPPVIAPGDTYIPVYRQATQPQGEAPYMWLKTDPETGQATELWEGVP